MKKLLIIICICFFTLISQKSVAQYHYLEYIQGYRDSIDAVFADTSSSILLKNEIPNFQGLNYFEADTNWIVEAKFRKKWFKKEFEMQTSTKRKPRYRKYGVIKFKVDQQKVKLTIYQNIELSKKEEYKDYLFCPFTDLTAPKESYGGGRYLDFKMADLDRKCKIDFNKSYNPYCAYNYKYSCPIPPAENHLKVRIEAGVKKWY